jgi:hypothetical protein
MLETVKADREARQVFLAMSREDQLLSILGMIAFTNSQVVNLQRDLISYRADREMKEQKTSDKLYDTGARIAQGIKDELAKQFNFWLWFRDKVLPTVVTVAVLALLYFIFGGKVPTP